MEDPSLYNRICSLCFRCVVSHSANEIVVILRAIFLSCETPIPSSCYSEQYTKTPHVMEWNPHTDHFRITIVEVHDKEIPGALGWYSPTIIQAKILVQWLWSAKIRWDDFVPMTLVEKAGTSAFRTQHALSKGRYYRLRCIREGLFWGCIISQIGRFHVAVLVISKTRVALGKGSSVWSCMGTSSTSSLQGCPGVANWLHSCMYWLFFSWTKGHPCRFHVSCQILVLTPVDNLAGCGMVPTELLNHELWPHWLNIWVT